MTYSRQHRTWVAALQGSGIDFTQLGLEIDGLYGRKSYGASSLPSVYPERSLVFRAFHEVMPDRVRVVILGQDPYPQPGSTAHPNGIADGLSFSARGHEPPPSLRHIFYNMWVSNEMTTPPRGADLQPWAAAGVLLLNSALSVEPSSIASVADQNRRRHLRVYRHLISSTLAHLSGPSGSDPAFLLLGGDARTFKSDIRSPRPDQVIELRHPVREPWPEPGGEQHPFARMNNYLGSRAIDWQI